ncbi:MAG TPA: nitroreductase family protein, partial [Acidimicrobiales bacterium]|nr:nitroreductase family protein [Acidimicrobiales bacterium]
EFVVMHGPAQMGRFWSLAADAAWVAAPDHPGLLRAQAAVVPLAAPGAYVARYNEPDKAASGWRQEADWPVPYWTVDAAMAAMTLLLAATDAGLGALFASLGRRSAAVRAGLGVPAGLDPIGMVLLGWPDRSATPTGSPARRVRRPLAEVVHRGGYAPAAGEGTVAGPAPGGA